MQPSSVTQADRALRLETLANYPVDTLLLRRFVGSEGLSELFQYELDLLQDHQHSGALELQPARLIGKPITFSLELPRGGARLFHGYVTRFERLAASHKFRRFRMAVSPALWFLTRRTSSRIFQNQSLKNIVETVLAEHGLRDFGWRGAGGSGQQVVEYCVQHQETDFAFVSRLLEAHGLSYYFEQPQRLPEVRGVPPENDPPLIHKLWICDPPYPIRKCLELPIELTTGDRDREGLASWRQVYDFRTARYSAADYNYLSAGSPLVQSVANSDLPSGPTLAPLEHFEFPGGFADGGAARDVADLRLAEEELGYEEVQAETNSPRFLVAHAFKFLDPTLSPQASEYVVRHVEHEAHETSYESDGDCDAPAYRGRITCFPKSARFVPPRTTARPIMRGLHSAKVVGTMPDSTTPAGGAPGGESQAGEVVVDALGRVRVQFPWNRDPKTCSCWLRVSQTWAGQGFGSMQIPWVGDEVLVDFLDGDPDRPLITGRVYNSERPIAPEFALPANRLRTVVARDTFGNSIHLAGATDGFQGLGLCTSAKSGDSSGDDDEKKKRGTASAVCVGFGQGFTYATEAASNVFSGGSEFRLVGGSLCEVGIGQKAEIFLGEVSDTFVGTRAETSLATEICFSMGTKYEYTASADMSLNVGGEMSIKYAGAIEVGYAPEVAYNMAGTGIVSMKEVTLLSGMMDKSSVKLTPESVELRVGTSVDISTAMPIVAAIAATAMAGANAVQGVATNAALPAVGSVYSVITKLVEGVAGTIITGATAGGTQSSEGQTEVEGQGDNADWMRTFTEKVNENVEGLASGSVFGAAGVIGATVSGVAAVVQLAILYGILKKLEAEPPETFTSSVLLDDLGVELSAGEKMTSVDAALSKLILGPTGAACLSASSNATLGGVTNNAKFNEEAGSVTITGISSLTLTVGSMSATVNATQFSAGSSALRVMGP